MHVWVVSFYISPRCCRDSTYPPPIYLFSRCLAHEKIERGVKATAAIKRECRLNRLKGKHHRRCHRERFDDTISTQDLAPKNMC
jgi:hypothetical protein